MMHDVVPFQTAQLESAALTVAQAFQDDPMFAYLSPIDRESRIPAIQWLSCRMIQYCALYHHVYTTPMASGIAAWLPPDQSSIGPLKLVQMAVQLGLYNLPWQFGWNRLSRWLMALMAIEQAHHRDMGDQPHWYLAILTVHPEAQGKGLGSQLIQPILQQANQEKLPCYLVTFTKQAVGFYQKHGFSIVAHQPLATDGPVFWTMHRDP